MDGREVGASSEHQKRQLVLARAQVRRYDYATNKYAQHSTCWCVIDLTWLITTLAHGHEKALLLV